MSRVHNVVYMLEDSCISRFTCKQMLLKYKQRNCIENLCTNKLMRKLRRKIPYKDPWSAANVDEGIS